MKTILAALLEFVKAHGSLPRASWQPEPDIRAPEAISPGDIPYLRALLAMVYAENNDDPAT